MYFVATLAPVPEIIAELRRRRPDLIVCYPSHLKQIAQEITPGDLQLIRPKLISVNSEMSTQAERDLLAEFFKCPVLDEYSSEELTRIAAQCEKKTYHLFEDINYMETLNADSHPTDGEGVIVGTNLHNMAMPMIRYCQNDIGTIRAGECQCGWHFRSLVGLQGRKNDCFVMPSGRILSSGFLLDATYEFLLAYRTAVRDFCLIQDTRTSVRLQVVTGDGWNSEIERAISARLRELFEPSVDFAINLVKVCDKTRTGKRNPIICRIGR
jgi:phenylacetate-CoA ligase